MNVTTCLLLTKRRCFPCSRKEKTKQGGGSEHISSLRLAFPIRLRRENGKCILTVLGLGSLKIKEMEEHKYHSLKHTHFAGTSFFIRTQESSFSLHFTPLDSLQNHNTETFWRMSGKPLHRWFFLVMISPLNKIVTLALISTAFLFLSSSSPPLPKPIRF